MTLLRAVFLAVCGVIGFTVGLWLDERAWRRLNTQALFRHG